MFSSSQRTIRKAGVLLLLFVFMSACAHKRNSAGRVPPPEDYFYHTVSFSGETLTAIAKWYTGSVQNWTRIQDENPSIDARKIRKGDTIRIPRTLVVRESPLPSNAIQVSNSGSNSSRTSSAASSPSSATSANRPTTPSANPEVAIPVAATENSKGKEIDQLPAAANSRNPLSAFSNANNKVPEKEIEEAREEAETIKVSTETKVPAVAAVSTPAPLEKPAVESAVTPKSEKPTAAQGKDREQLLKELLEEY